MTRSALLRTLESEVGVLVRRVRRVLWTRARLVPPDLHPGQYLMLGLLRERAARASTVAEELGMDKGAVSRGVQHLVDLGLVDRTEDPDDRRASLLQVSKDGRARLAQIECQRRKRLATRLADVDDTELAQMVAVLRRYNEALED